MNVLRARSGPAPAPAAADAAPPGGPVRAPRPAPGRDRTAVLGGGLVVAVAVLAVAVVLSLAVGAKSVPLGTVLDTVFHHDSGDADQTIVTSLRLPRTVVGLLAGAALGLAGTVMQGLTRNPLADPGLLGVDAGASLAVVTAISVFGITSFTGYVWFGFVGAAVAALLVHFVGSLGREGATPVKLALAGAAVSAGLTSLTTAVLLTDTATFDRFRFWEVGSLAGRELSVAGQAGPFLLVGAVCALGSGRLLNTLSLGEDTARGLGQNIAAARVFCAASVVLLCGAATALAGPIGFVGLTVPHIVRSFTGPDHRWVLPYSMLVAPALLLVSDVVGRVVARPGEIQVGIVTAVLGAPVLIALVRRGKQARL
ncbi:iron complex transport system permease protein [Actinacidiphila alni]|uniref:Iron complex transport system permease protein n=1 Tax=Actinacidiphila alni TaxID=380248 RepID=A0A1I2BAL1_9ACTN|nr:iron chelate uptake ABC transporter family permease subunit [Actinacidiphila alni]SFE53191.1 iron complex transport system permease protein [Actinacidiphila alni]